VRKTGGNGARRCYTLRFAKRFRANCAGQRMDPGFGASHTGPGAGSIPGFPLSSAVFPWRRGPRKDDGMTARGRLSKSGQQTARRPFRTDGVALRARFFNAVRAMQVFEVTPGAGRRAVRRGRPAALRRRDSTGGSRRAGCARRVHCGVLKGSGNDWRCGRD